MTVRPHRAWRETVVAMSFLAIALPLHAGDGTKASIAEVLAEMPEDVRVYNDHLVTLASPFMQGRLPGSRGMEIATEYMEYWFREAGLQPAFPIVETDDEGKETIVSDRASYRQSFPLGGTLSVSEAKLALAGTEDGEDGKTFEVDEDYIVTTLGGSGEVTAPITFVGYSIDNGPDDYSSYSDSDDLTGRVAMMFRFEPMKEDGTSQWSENAWSRRAGFAGKIRAAADRNAEAIIVVNTPGADDPRIESLNTGRGGGRGTAELPPVLLMSPDAATELIGAGEGGRPSLLQLRRLADMGRIMVDFDVEATIEAKLERHSITAENVGGLIPGKGDLADEYIVVGAHLDHLGMGYFGSRSGSGKLHPGADDNASGAAGILIFADKLIESYAAMPEDADARTVVFVGFSGEESGLNGSRYYVEHPIVPIEDHDMMVNFDMIGRIEEGRLAVSGARYAEGMEAWMEPFFEASELTVETPRGGGGSDHLPFRRAGVPALFGILAKLHADYHTPADTSDKINRVAAVETIRMFHDIVLASAQRPERWEFVEPTSDNQRGGGGGPSVRDIKVRFGVIPSYNDEEGGIAVESVTEGGSAGLAGVLPGDRLVRWDGVKIEDVRSWMTQLATHKPGDKVKIGVMRDGEEVTLEVTLQAR